MILAKIDSTPHPGLLLSEEWFCPTALTRFRFAQPPSPVPTGEGIYFVGRLPGAALTLFADPGLLSFAAYGAFSFRLRQTSARQVGFATDFQRRRGNAALPEEFCESC